MPSVHELLKDSGFSDAEITALDNRAITTFNNVLSTAERERQEATAAQQAAELAQRSNIDYYENKIAPSLTAWDEQKQQYDADRARQAAENAYLREVAKGAGIDVSDLPGSGPQRDGQGRYVAGVPGSTPGSPTFDVNQVYQRAGDAVGVIADIQWEHEKLYGEKLPISPTELIRQADRVKLDPRTYASRQFKWDEKRTQMSEAAQKKHDDEVAARAVREWADKHGNNPDVRVPAPSRFSDIQKARANNTIPDPLSLNDQQRRALTSQMIRKDIADQDNNAG